MAGERLYKAYVVRLWTVHQNAGLLWRASVEDIHTGERRAFADLASLCRFLREVAALPAVAVESDAAVAGEPGNQEERTS